MFGFSILMLKNGLKGRHSIIRDVKQVSLREDPLFMHLEELLIALTGSVLSLKSSTLIILMKAGLDTKICRFMFPDIRL